MTSTLDPKINIGPGQIIQRNREALGWSGKDLAEALGLSEKTIGLLINNELGISQDSAARLGRVFGSSPEFWLNLERNYRMRTHERRGATSSGESEDRTR